MVEDYIWKRKNMVTQHIATQSLLDLCEATKRTLGPRVVMQWWEQSCIDLAGTRETLAAAAEEDEYGVEE